MEQPSQSLGTEGRIDALREDIGPRSDQGLEAEHTSRVGNSTERIDQSWMWIKPDHWLLTGQVMQKTLEKILYESSRYHRPLRCPGGGAQGGGQDPRVLVEYALHKWLQDQLSSYPEVSGQICIDQTLLLERFLI